MIITDNFNNFGEIYKPFLDEYSYISFSSDKLKLNESLGISELHNEVYHKSLDDASLKILYAVENRKKYPIANFTETSYDENGKESEILERYNDLILLSDINVNGVSWIDKVNVLIKYPAAETNAILLSNTERLIGINPGKWQETKIHIYNGTDIYIPLKMSNDKITQCFIFIILSADLPDIEKISTILDHELGHAKNALEHQSDIKYMNSDLIDLNAIYYSYIDLNSNIVMKNRVDTMHLILSNKDTSSFIKQNFINNSRNVDDEVIISWFIFHANAFNSSEIVQHRKNFFDDIKKALRQHRYNCSAETYMLKYSEDYKYYSDLAQVLRSLVDFVPTKIKKDVVFDFIKPIVSADRGDSHKKYIYGKIFAGRNKNFGVNAFDEFMLFHLNNIEKYFIKRCRRLFKAYITTTVGHERNIYEMRHYAAAKKIVDCAEEELLMDA